MLAESLRLRVTPSCEPPVSSKAESSRPRAESFHSAARACAVEALLPDRLRLWQQHPPATWQNFHPRILQGLEVRRCVHIAGEAEKRRAVIGKNGAINAHQAADRHPRIPGQHLVTHEVERNLRAGDVSANGIAQAKRQLADHGSNIFPESIGQSRQQHRLASRQIRPHECA